MTPAELKNNQDPRASSSRQVHDDESVNESSKPACMVASTSVHGVHDENDIDPHEAPPPPYRSNQSPVNHHHDQENYHCAIPGGTSVPVDQSFGQPRYRPASVSSEYAASNTPSCDDAAIAAVMAREGSDVPVIPGSEKTEVDVVGDGRIHMHIQESRLITSILDQSWDTHCAKPALHRASGSSPQSKPTSLNIVMHVVGSRGDVQPFVSLAQTLQRYGHRLRLATHPCFQDFVLGNGIEFFSIGGDSAQLMAYMVRNPGLVPGMGSVARGEIGKRQKEIHGLLLGCWRSCYEPGNGFDPPLSQSSGSHSGHGGKPFIADVIIANPPSSAHIHCAEKLGIPLHILFTMPWSPTLTFPHPLANIMSSTTEERRANFISYALVEALIWQGLGRTINCFRQETLFLDPLGTLSGPAVLARLRIPHTYCWSPALIPKPDDWEEHISISGFCFLDQGTTYVPDPELAAFLAAGPPPIYIGFGSIVVDDPDELTRLLFTVVKRTGRRALISQGWGGLGKEGMYIPSNVHMLGNVPHDWLFRHVSCIVHHGGAGTTSTGIALGKPTVVVSFFADQPFWGFMIARAGAGPPPIPFKELTVEKLVNAILTALEPRYISAAQDLAGSMALEHGSETAAEKFHQALGVDELRCDLAPDRTAVWRVKRKNVKLSAFAAIVLSEEGLLDLNDLRLYRAREYPTERGAADPISGGIGTILGAVGDLLLGMIDIPINVAKAVVAKSPDAVPRGSSRPSPAMDGQHTECLTTLGSSQAVASETETFRSSIFSNKLNESEQSEDGASNLLHPALWTSSSSHARSPHDLLYPTTARDSPAELGTEIGKKSARSKPKAKITAGKAFGFGFVKEMSGSESVARSAFLDDTTGPIKNHPGGSTGSDAALGLGKGLGRMVAIGMRVPVDFAMGITTGFNNVPKMYGDTTVRPTQKVTGFNSGIRAASKGLGHGVYDGVTGLFVQPMRGAREEGIAGFVKGLGRGVGGSVLKPGAAIFGIAGYALKGTWQELQNHFDARLQSYIIAVRRAEGVEALQNASLEERDLVIQRWTVVSTDERMKAKDGVFDRWKAVQRSRTEWRQSQKGQLAVDEREGLVF